MYVLVHSSVSSRFKRPKDACAVRARGFLMAKILNTRILSIVLYNLFLARHCNISIQSNIFIRRYIGCLQEIEIQILKNSDWAKKRLNTKYSNALLAMTHTT